MFARYLSTLWASGVIAIAGCASHRVETTTPEPRLGHDIPSLHAQEEPGAWEPIGVGLEEPTGPLTLRQALALALERNPELAAFSWEARAREAEVLQAGAAPNPGGTVEVENFAGSGELGGFGLTETTIGLSQLLELGGKRGKRRRVADHSRSLAEWDYETKRVDVFTDVTKNYVALLVAQEQAALAKELVTVSEQMLEAVTRRMEAGGTSSVEQSRAKVELQTTRINSQRAQREIDLAKRRLSALWGDTSPGFAEARGAIEETVPVPPLDGIIERVDDNPDLARWTAEIAQRDALAALERSRSVPDLEVGIGIRRFAETDDNTLVAGFALPLPIFNRNQEAMRAAECRVAVAREARRAALVRAEMRLTSAHQELVQSHSELTALRSEILPEATSAFEAARTAYQRGRVRLTDVLDAQRTLFTLRSRYYDALGTYHQRKADIERLIGAPVEDEEGR